MIRAIREHERRLQAQPSCSSGTALPMLDHSESHHDHGSGDDKGDSQAAHVRESDGNARTVDNNKGGPRRLHVIALTAMSLASDRDRALEMGMDDFITKVRIATIVVVILYVCA